MRLCEWLFEFDSSVLEQADVPASSADALSNDQADRLWHVETSSTHPSHPHQLERSTGMCESSEQTLSTSGISEYLFKEGYSGRTLDSIRMSSGNIRLAEVKQRRH
jgi:hypothetical protein